MKRLGVVVSVLVVALVGSLLARVAIVESEDPLVVVHWSNSHPLREDLLQKMADRFNDENPETAVWPAHRDQDRALRLGGAGGRSGGARRGVCERPRVRGRR